ncbi:unnamed protein product [Rhizophagus irregularis]|nr:unnamed protein product [Rhizophagus irregularis]
MNKRKWVTTNDLRRRATKGRGREGSTNNDEVQEEVSYEEESEDNDEVLEDVNYEGEGEGEDKGEGSDNDE